MHNEATNSNEVEAVEVVTPLAYNMTLRDYFAGQIISTGLNGDVIKSSVIASSIEEAGTTLAEAAYALADAMIEARK